LFQLIGVVVVAFVLYAGWDAFQGWYAGEATPQEIVEKVRNRVGDVISNGDNSEPSGKTDSDIPPFREEPIENVVPTAQQTNEPPPPPDLSSQTRDMLNEALK